MKVSESAPSEITRLNARRAIPYAIALAYLFGHLPFLAPALEDIDSSNAVASSTIADAQIEFSGRGVLADNQKQGWFARIFSKIRPF